MQDYDGRRSTVGFLHLLEKDLSPIYGDLAILDQLRYGCTLDSECLESIIEHLPWQFIRDDDIIGNGLSFGLDAEWSYSDFFILEGLSGLVVVCFGVVVLMDGYFVVDDGVDVIEDICEVLPLAEVNDGFEVVNSLPGESLPTTV